MWRQWEVNQDGHMGALLPLSSMSPTQDAGQMVKVPTHQIWMGEFFFQIAFCLIRTLNENFLLRKKFYHYYYYSNQVKSPPPTPPNTFVVQ